jgi:diguanylate cyclase (GGDEF)-like protein
MLVFAGESLATLGYLLSTLDGPHRPVLIALTSVMVVAVVACIPFADRFASMKWRAQYSFAWTIVAGVILAASIHLDRGFESPLFFLLALPIMSAALALEIRQVIACAVATVGEFTYIWLYDPHDHRSTSLIAMFAMGLLGLVVVAVGVSVARSRLMEEDVELRLELSMMATTDPLTGCLNYGAFYERLETEINRALRHREPLGLLMIDLDFFKAFNDTYGHLAGDDALRSVGAALMKVGRSFDTVGRIGGDEFAVILPTSTLQDASRIADRVSALLTSAERPTVSVGFGALDLSEPSAKRLVRDADRRLYEVKANGRGRSNAQIATNPSPRTTPYTAHDRDVAAKAIAERIRLVDHASAKALSILDSYLSASFVAMGFVDRDFRFVRINPRFGDLIGESTRGPLGRTIEEVVPNLWSQLEPFCHFAVDTNTPLANQVLSLETPSEPGVTRTWLANLHCVTVDREVVGLGIVLVDITGWRPPASHSFNHVTATIT